jgi:hypothetical protein
MKFSGIDQNKIELAKTDLAGIHTQHANAWSSFNTTLQIIYLIDALPWIAAGSLLRGDVGLTTMFRSRVLQIVLVFSGLMGVIGYMVLVYNRLMILLYARALNGYRSFFSDDIPVSNFLPVDPDFPPFRDSRGIMLLLTISLVAINSTYLALASFMIVENVCLAILCAILVLAGVTTFIVLWYLRATRTVHQGGFGR